MKNSRIRRYTFLLLTLCTVASVTQNVKYVNLFIGTPGYYSTAFTNGFKTELTAPHAMAVECYKFHRSISAALWVDFSSTFEDVAILLV